MFYRVTADLFFTSEDEANDFYHDCELACPKSSVINPGEANQEQARILLQRCFHNEQPPRDCETIHAQTCPPP